LSSMVNAYELLINVVTRSKPKMLAAWTKRYVAGARPSICFAVDIRLPADREDLTYSGS
jgi:hypothetical protein